MPDTASGAASRAPRRPDSLPYYRATSGTGFPLSPRATSGTGSPLSPRATSGTGFRAPHPAPHRTAPRTGARERALPGVGARDAGGRA